MVILVFSSDEERRSCIDLMRGQNHPSPDFYPLVLDRIHSQYQFEGWDYGTANVLCCK